MKNKILFLSLLFISFSTFSFCQDTSSEGETEGEKIRHHWLNLFTGYTVINKALTDEGKNYILIPTIGLDYEYRFNHKWAISSVNDLEMASYTVEVDEENDLKRKYAFVTAVVVAYEFLPFWGVFAGPGYEFEEHQNFFVTKIGTEFVKSFGDDWAVAATLSVDIKEVNTSTSFGIIVKKALSKAK